MTGAYNRQVSRSSDAFRTTMDLFEMGVAIARQNVRRTYPQADAAAIERRVNQWLRTRPGAEFGDCPGRQFEMKAGPSDIARSLTP